ncbi:MAG: hypothetical protein WBM69_19890 [Desulfobacterales bacterium]
MSLPRPFFCPIPIEKFQISNKLVTDFGAELAAKPSGNTYVFAAREAHGNRKPH